MPVQRMNTPQGADSMDRGYRAVQLRAQRKTFQQIADELGYVSKASAHNAYTRHLALMSRDSPEAASLRVAESEHLDYLRSKIMDQVEIGDLAAIDRAVKISERYSKLNGLDLNESRMVGAMEAGAVASLMASSNLHAGIIAAMGKIGMPLEMQDRLIAAINEWLSEQQQPEDEPDTPAEMIMIEGEVER